MKSPFLKIRRGCIYTYPLLICQNFFWWIWHSAR